MPAFPTRSPPTCAASLSARRPEYDDTGQCDNTRRIWSVKRLGYRVPRVQFDGTVHAVFARACYIECGDTLLTLAAATLADGPTTLLLGSEAAADLRGAFRRGDTVRCRGGRVHSRGAALDLRSAQTWQVPDPRPDLAASDIPVRVALARTRLAQVRRTHSSVLDRSGEAAIARLTRACRDLDSANALDHATRFVGWGEGLTPAGDDYLVGLCAALGALVQRDAGRRDFLDRLREFLAAQQSRTTPIAAHCLKLAALGHFNADILRAIDALRSETDSHAAQRALDDVMAVGATSGADVLTGILSGFTAWSGLSIMECKR
jgi:hypothetical protein